MKITLEFISEQDVTKALSEMMLGHITFTIVSMEGFDPHFQDKLINNLKED